MYTVIEYSNLPKFKRKYEAYRFAEELAKSKKKDTIILQVTEVVKKPKQAMKIFFDITGLDYESITEINTNNTEQRIKRAWFVYILVHIEGLKPSSAARKLKFSTNVVYEYLHFIPQYAKNYEYEKENKKWKPLIKYIKKHYPGLL